MCITLQLRDMAAAIIKQSGLQHCTLLVTSIKPGTFQIHNVNIQWQCNFIVHLSAGP